MRMLIIGATADAIGMWAWAEQLATSSVRKSQAGPERNNKVSAEKGSQRGARGFASRVYRTLSKVHVRVPVTNWAES